MVSKLRLQRSKRMKLHIVHATAVVHQLQFQQTQVLHLLQSMQHPTTSPQVVYISIPSPSVKFSQKMQISLSSVNNFTQIVNSSTRTLNCIFIIILIQYLVVKFSIITKHFENDVCCRQLPLVLCAPKTNSGHAVVTEGDHQLSQGETYANVVIQSIWASAILPRVIAHLV